MHSSLGSLYLVASAAGLRGVYWTKQAFPMLSALQAKSMEASVLSRSAEEISEYLSGKRKSFEFPVDPVGTPFQKRVWLQLQKIPYGRTCSYGEIARKLKKPRAVRAVGTANARNPLCIVIPCHRVIASNGTLGGYSGGLKKKQRLLSLESM
jgi:methylated-DNA-[protein]-cysteine S-methyltransferase